MREDRRAAAQAAHSNEAPPALLNLHEEIQKADLICVDSGDNEPQPKRRRTGDKLTPCCTRGLGSLCDPSSLHNLLLSCMHGLLHVHARGLLCVE